MKQFLRSAHVYIVIVLAWLTVGFDHPKALYQEPERSPLEQGRALEEQHEYAKAEAQYQQIDSTIVRDMTLQRLATAWEGINANITRSQAAVNQQPQSAQARLQLAQDYYSKGLLCSRYTKGSMGEYPRDFVFDEQEYYYQEALRQTKKAIQLQANLPEAYLLIGEVYLANSARTEALKELKRVIKKYPDFARGYYAMGKVYFDMKNTKMTERYFIRAIKLDPILHDAYYLLGKFYFERKWFDYAALTFLEVLRKNPRDWPSLDMLADSCHELGKYYVQKGKYDRAINLFQEILRVKPVYGVQQSLLLARRQKEEALKKAEAEKQKRLQQLAAGIEEAQPTPTPTPTP
jgi:tetratricopeptide (TPR) repeat protein